MIQSLPIFYDRYVGGLEKMEDRERPVSLSTDAKFGNAGKRHDIVARALELVKSGREREAIRALKNCVDASHLKEEASTISSKTECLKLLKKIQGLVVL